MDFAQELWSLVYVFCVVSVYHTAARLMVGVCIGRLAWKV